MEVKLIVVLIALTLMVNLVVADFLFNHPSPKADELDTEAGYKCVPGRTIIKITEKKLEIVMDGKSDSEEYRLREGPNREETNSLESIRRSHMTVPTQDESCQMCVCSAEGKHEYCSNRPAASLNECLMMKGITEKFDMGLPFEHMNSLYNRIRRVNNEEINRRKCVPLISEYTDCNEDSLCTGCSRCKCDASGQWECHDVQECRDEDKKFSKDDDLGEGDIFDDALLKLESDMEKKKFQRVKVAANKRVPLPRYVVGIPRQEH